MVLLAPVVFAQTTPNGEAVVSMQVLSGPTAQASATAGQILHADGPLPSYEVATIKPASGAGMLFGPGGARNVSRFAGTTKMLLEAAFNIPTGSDTRVIGGPSWLNNDRYTIEGKIPDDLVAKSQTMTVDQRVRQMHLMQQSLLADRFKLKVHFETREMPIYELVVAKGGSKLTPAKDPPIVPEAPPATSTPPVAGNPPLLPGPGGMNPATMRQGVMAFRKDGGTEMTVKGMTLDAVIQGPFFGVHDRSIVNKTGLMDRYDFTLNWAPDQVAAPGAENAAPAGDGPSIFTALEEQLGLKLVPAKGPVEVIVIDSIERPSEN